MSNNEKKPYFAEREEKAVLDYIKSNSEAEKNRIYNNILIEPFNKMVQSILRRYPIHIGNYEIEELEFYAIAHLIEHMVKFNPFIIERKSEIKGEEKWVKLGGKYRFFYIEDANDKLQSLSEDETDLHEYRLFHSKAFSYCQTIVRNYFKDHSKKTNNEKKINLCFDDYSDTLSESIEHSYEIDQFQKIEELINGIVDKIEEKVENDDSLKRNEVIVGDAIVNILKNWNVLFMEDSPDGRYDKKITNKFAKNKILLFLKEQTNLNTKEIRLAMKPFKSIYSEEKMNFFES